MRSTPFLIGVFLIAACAPEPVTPHSAGVVGACANLRALGCPEANGVAGGDTCEVIVARRHGLRSLPLDCWEHAGSVASARACGSLRCVQ